MGLSGASTSAKIATRRSAATMPTPTSAVVLRRNRRIPWTSGDSARSPPARQATAGSSASRVLPPLMGCGFTPVDSPPLAMLPSRIANAGIQERVAQVYEEVHHDEGERRQQGEALHLLVVAGDDRVDAERAEAGHGEKRLYHDRAADEEADLKPHHRDGRDERVLQRVLEDDRPLGEALGAGGRDVLGADDFQHAGAEQPRQERGPPDPEGGRSPPRPNEKRSRSRTPMKNSGMETPIMATVVAV